MIDNSVMTDPDSTVASDTGHPIRSDPLPATLASPAPGRPAAAGGHREPAPGAPPGRYGLPRGLIITLGLRRRAWWWPGMRAIPGIIGPVFMALVLTITVNPIRGWLLRHGANRAVASLAVFLTVFAIIVGLFAATVVGIVQLATLLPQYSDQIQQELSGLQSWLAGMGVTQADIQSTFSSISSSQIAAFAEGLLSSMSSIFSFVLFMVVVLIFLAVDGAIFGERMAEVAARAGAGAERAGRLRQGHPEVLRRGHRLRRHRRGAGRGGIADPGDPGGRAVGAAGLRHQLHPQRRFHHRPDPAGNSRSAGRRPEPGHRRHRRVLRAEFHHPVGAATEIRRRRGRA